MVLLSPSEAPLAPLTSLLLLQLLLGVRYLLLQVSILPAVLAFPEVHVLQNIPGSVHGQSL